MRVNGVDVVRFGVVRSTSVVCSSLVNGFRDRQQQQQMTKSKRRRKWKKMNDILSSLTS